MERNKLLQGIDAVIVRVSDIETVKDWYLKKLGLATVWDDPIAKLTVLDTLGPTSLTIWQASEPVVVNKSTATYPIFKTPDAAALREERTKRGVQVDELITDDYVTCFFFYDKDGNVFEACQVHG